MDDTWFSSIFQFFYSIYDHFLRPQKTLHCFTLLQSKDPYKEKGFKQLEKLLSSSNGIIGDDNYFEVAYKNFRLKDRSVSQYITIPELYLINIRGSDGLVVFVSVLEGKEFDLVVGRGYKFNLLDVLKLAKCDDTKTIPYPKATPPCKKSDFRPILFVILAEKEAVIEKARVIIEDSIEKAEYEKENTLVVMHSELESNIYEGLEWIFIKKSA